ncbi:hypothetical protein Tco_0878093 [Tanacetum coccineum]|uniref:Uncharacterized protein n=1 Tax=Tanacetum coccineum TaxID=301880 RepID=A0ABQ5BZE8_9ASTR
MSIESSTRNECSSSSVIIVSGDAKRLPEDTPIPLLLSFTRRKHVRLLPSSRLLPSWSLVLLLMSKTSRGLRSLNTDWA